MRCAIVGLYLRYLFCAMNDKNQCHQIRSLMPITVLKRLWILAFMLFLAACNQTPPEYVTLKEGKFECEGKPFFPLMLNYVVEFRYAENQFFLSPTMAYERENAYENADSLQTAHQLKGHFKLIREMGFNSVRICLDRLDSEKEHYYYPASYRKLSLRDQADFITKAIHELVQMANKEGLKVMLLIKPPYDNDMLKQFTRKLLSEMSHVPGLFAYDFFNEPLYFDEKNDASGARLVRPKNEAISIVREWKEMMGDLAPRQLFTIGFSEPIEVFEWDPSMLPVDFICFHTYHPLRIPNEIYWYSKYSGKPWMIGETSLPADNKKVSYADQHILFNDVMQRILNCGGIGIGWWEFQEIPGTHFEAQFTGILNREGITYTADKKHAIIGSLKPVVSAIKKANELKKTGDCICMSNYYNMLGYSNYLLETQVIDSDTEEPIEGAVIRGWNDDWKIGLNTFSDVNGRLKISSNTPCVHFEVSALGYQNKKFDHKTSYRHVPPFEKTMNEDLEYQEIHYKPFLDTLKQPRSLFKFNSKLFSKYKFKGRMPIITLKKLDASGWEE